jgi:hypothetical protein
MAAYGLCACDNGIHREGIATTGGRDMLTRFAKRISILASVSIPIACLATAVSIVDAGEGTKFAANPGDQPVARTSTGQNFRDLNDKTEVVYLLAYSSIVVGPDPNGSSEEITFVGTVDVPKFPLKGFDRRQLSDGRVQIDFELTNSQLTGESFLLDGTVRLGEHPELKSLGTITQRAAGTDYPADFIVMRKVLMETPAGILYNKDPVPVRGIIDAVPPVRREWAIKNKNVFHGEELPVQLVDKQDQIAGWFYSTAHVAYAIDAVEIYRAVIEGQFELQVNDKIESVKVAGPIEAVLRKASDGSLATEVIKLGLRGHSDLLGGRIMFTESFDEGARFSLGSLGIERGAGGGPAKFDLYVDIRTPSNLLAVEKPILISGQVTKPVKTGEVAISERTVPIYTFSLSSPLSGDGTFKIVTEADKEVGTLRRIVLNTPR